MKVAVNCLLFTTVVCLEVTTEGIRTGTGTEMEGERLGSTSQLSSRLCHCRQEFP